MIQRKTNDSAGRSLDQRRATHAMGWVEKVKGAVSPKDCERYRAYVDRLGPAVVINGLGQALAMEHAQAGGGSTDPHRMLAGGLEAWLSDPGCALFAAGDMLRQLCTSDQQTYLRAQAEALAWLTWHKRLCRAAFGSEGDDA